MRMRSSEHPRMLTSPGRLASPHCSLLLPHSPTRGQSRLKSSAQLQRTLRFDQGALPGALRPVSLLLKLRQRRREGPTPPRLVLCSQVILDEQELKKFIPEP
mmetsp:Transcript_21547/g.50207  ORF Transcript_21547/g.50207 Transcript_21547/m.50207 type:complete len:102 (+) Transcript_21547:67-372(+)